MAFDSTSHLDVLQDSCTASVRHYMELMLPCDFFCVADAGPSKQRGKLGVRELSVLGQVRRQVQMYKPIGTYLLKSKCQLDFGKSLFSIS